MYVSWLNHSTYIIYYPQSHIYKLFRLAPLPTFLPNFLLFSTYCTQPPSPLTLPCTYPPSSFHSLPFLPAYILRCLLYYSISSYHAWKPLQLSGLKQTVHVFHSVSHLSVLFSLQYLTPLLFIASPPIPATPLKFQIIYSLQYAVSTI